MSDKANRESQYLISRLELDSDPLIGLDRDLGRDKYTCSNCNIIKSNKLSHHISKQFTKHF